MAFDQNSLTITDETAKFDVKMESFDRKLYDVAEPYSMHVRLLFNVGRKKNCPTWKRKNKNHTIKAERKVLISVVVCRAV